MPYSHADTYTHTHTHTHTHTQTDLDRQSTQQRHASVTASVQRRSPSCLPARCIALPCCLTCLSSSFRDEALVHVDEGDGVDGAEVLAVRLHDLVCAHVPLRDALVLLYGILSDE